MASKAVKKKPRKAAKKAVSRKPSKKEAADPRYYFDEKLARFSIEFFPKFLRLTKGKRFAGKPYHLAKWQEEVNRTLFGWRRQSGKKRYNRCQIWIPKKNGKSTYAAGLCVMILMVFPEPSGEIYCAANDKKQARIVFEQAKGMIEANPVLKKRCQIFKNHIIGPMNTVFRPLSADIESNDGINSSVIIVDEIHRFRSRDYLDMLEYSTIGRDDPLFITLSTAGDAGNFGSIGWEYYQQAKQAKADPESNPNLLSVIYEADAEDDISQESTWLKANPSLAEGILDIETFREDFNNAVISPAKFNNFKRLRLNLWVTGDEKFFDVGEWMECGHDYTFEELLDFPCYLGLDLSSTRDYTCAHFLFSDEKNEILYTWPFFFIPRENVADRAREEKLPLLNYIDEGYLIATEGDVIDQKKIRTHILDIYPRLKLFQAGGFDVYNASGLVSELIDGGMEMLKFPQDMRHMNEPTKELQRLILSRGIRHNRNPLMNWMIANCYAYISPEGNVKLKKMNKSTPFRVDGVIALVIAIGTMMAIKREEGGSGGDIRAMMGVFGGQAEPEEGKHNM